MNFKIYKALEAFARKHDLKSLDKLTVYQCFDEIAQEDENAHNLHIFLKTIDDKKESQDTADTLMASLQILLPELCPRDKDNKRAPLSQQINEIKTRVSDSTIHDILSYLSDSRNKQYHKGIIPAICPVKDMYGDDKNENYFNLACLIMYTVFWCRSIGHTRPKHEKLAIFRYRWRAVTPGNYPKMARVSWFEGWAGVIPFAAIKIIILSVIGGCVGLGLCFFIFCCGLLREIREDFTDKYNFTELSEQEVKDFVTEISKPERAYFISERMYCLDRGRNYYRVGDEKISKTDQATEDLYKMARKNMLPNAHNFWGVMTMTTIGFCKTPILKATSHIPSGHKYMKARKFGKKRQSTRAELYAKTENYANTPIYIHTGDLKHECNKLRKFATALAKRHRAEYLIVTNPEKGTKCASNAKAALKSAGIKSNMIQTATDERIGSDIAYIKVRITL